MRQLKIATQITNRDSQAVEKYLQEISKISMITPEEETTLAQKIHMGDQRALEKLVKANLRFVVSVAKQYQHQGLSLSDLINLLIVVQTMLQFMLQCVAVIVLRKRGIGGSEAFRMPFFPLPALIALAGFANRSPKYGSIFSTTRGSTGVVAW